jgi:molybdopterin converting factor subunit 1
MRVRVRLFARQREIARASRVDLELPDGATIDQAWSALVGTLPELASGRPYVRFARNGSYADADEPLADGDELACIPPVAGGAGEEAAGADSTDGGAPSLAAAGAGGAGARVRRIALTADPIDDAALARLRVALASPADGAVVTFAGRTRETPGTPAPGEEAEAARHAGASVRALEYEAYEEMALAVLDTIADEIEARFDVHRVGILHRTGLVPLGEASVAVVVAAPHRGAAFDACRYAIDELKGRAPIWKAEQFADGSVWMGQPARSAANDDRSARPASSAPEIEP